MNNIIVNLFNIFYVGPLIIYIGINNTNTSDYFYNLLGISALTIPFIISQSSCTLYKSQWLVLLSFFIYVALSKNNTPIFIYYLFILFGYYIITLHCYYMYQILFVRNILL